jgi:thioredoxin reductase (NADPH)
MILEKEILIIGAGASGLQAGIYSARRKADVLVVGKIDNSSLLYAEVENFFGSEKKIAGKELLENAKKQLLNFGAELIEEDVISVNKSQDEKFLITLESEKQILAKSIIIATGISRKKLGVKGEKEFVGKGVSYCVDCDGMFFRNKIVAITGNGSSAVHGALTLSNYVSNVYFITSIPEKIQASDESFKKIQNNSKIKIIDTKKILEIQGDDFVKKIIFDDSTELEVNAIFIELGAKGAFDLFSDFGLELDPLDFKHIKVNSKQETNIKGIFASGDICGAPYQVAKAVGQGCIAGIEAVEYVKK